MPNKQSGANATANFHGDYNDVSGHQIKVVVHEKEKTRPPTRSETSLECTIRVIQKLANSVPIDAVKSILMDIAAMLSLLQKLAKRNSLNHPTRSCKAICSTLVLATNGVSADRVTGIFWYALNTLRSAIEGLRLRLGNALKSRLMQRMFGAGPDVDEINAWTAELEKISVSFSARLNIIPVIPLEQIQELQQQLGVLTSIPDPPPLPPAMFFGRETLLRDVKAALLRDENVVLIGPGGIGKSTLAMALMNEEDVIEHCRRRFFVTYASADPKTITFSSFVECIARVLGLSTANVDSEHQIKMNLGLSRVLLVLDNADTFEEAVDRNEATRISKFTADLANTPGVTVMLTSRTSSNARRVAWAQFNVPPLERESARRSFREIYKQEINDEEIDGLLTEVDFHPLSISVLAHTAKENRWTGKMLLGRWKSQRGEILWTRDGRDNLWSTIMLSLESPSVKELGADAMRVLWIVAFFPQGINQENLLHMFPSLSRIATVMDTLSKVSLIYFSPPFLTMLAPIRLLLLYEFKDVDRELLPDIRHFYYSSLRAISRKEDSGSILLSDHLNIEHLIIFDIKQPPLDIVTIRHACHGFLFGLAWHKPRPSPLDPLISSLPEESTIEQSSKAWCLHALGSLYFELSTFSRAAAFNLTARTLFICADNHPMASLCTFNVATSYNNGGYFLRARQLVDNFISSPSWQKIDQDLKNTLHYVLDTSRVQTSSEGADSLFMRSMDHGFSGLASRTCHWQARMWHGFSTPGDVQKHLELLRSDCMSSPDVWDRWRFLSAMAEVAFLQRRYDAATTLLDQARGAVCSNLQLTMLVLTCRATVASEQGCYDLARSLLERGLDTYSLVGMSSTDFLRLLYARGRNELYAGQHATARRFLVDVVAHCDAQGDIYTKTLCLRALGEVDESGSDKYFGQAVVLCGESGTPPALFGVCTPMLKLDDDKFPGWKRYLQANGLG